jgi:hypothetical protein
MPYSKPEHPPGSIKILRIALGAESSDIVSICFAASLVREIINVS